MSWCSLCLVHKFIMVVEGRKLQKVCGFYASAGSIQDIGDKWINEDGHSGWEMHGQER